MSSVDHSCFSSSSRMLNTLHIQKDLNLCHITCWKGICMCVFTYVHLWFAYVCVRILRPQTGCATGIFHPSFPSLPFHLPLCSDQLKPLDSKLYFLNLLAMSWNKAVVDRERKVLVVGVGSSEGLKTPPCVFKQYTRVVAQIAQWDNRSSWGQGSNWPPSEKKKNLVPSYVTMQYLTDFLSLHHKEKSGNWKYPPPIRSCMLWPR